MIETFLRFDISLYSALMLTLILLMMGQRKDTMSISSRLFRRLIYVNIYMLLMEIVSWQFDGLPGTFNWYANYISNMLFGWSTVLITCVWAAYVDFRIFGSVKRLRKRWYYVQPLIANTILFVINLFWPIVFSVSPENVYARESYMWLTVLINSVGMGYLCYLAYKNRSTIQKKVVLAILLFISLPAVTAGLQVLIYGVFILWPMMAVTLVVTYIYLETTSTSSDYLTGLFSRLRLDEYIDVLLNTDQSFGVIMLDLNDFKQINDTYGHHKGDEALIMFSNALNKVFHNEKMVGRYAGDEFVIVTEVLSPEELNQYNIQLDKTLDFNNQLSLSEYKISYSMGYQSSLEMENLSYSTMLNGADQKMYKSKKAYKESNGKVYQ